MKKSENFKEGIYLPSSVLDINKQIDVLRTLVDKFQKEGQEISYKDIGGIQASKANVSGSLSFYANIGWLIKSRNKYAPSKTLIHYFKGIDKEKARKELLQLLLQNCSVAKEVIFFTEQKSKSDRESIIKYLGTRFNFLEKDKKSLNRLLDLLTLLKILKEDGEGCFFLEESEKKTASIFIPQDNEKEKIEPKAISIPAAQEKVNICIGIMLTPEASEEQMRKSIKIILEEIKKIKE